MILNNRLRWDGTDLGSYPATIITNIWKIDNVTYFGLTLEEGIIYCHMNKRKDYLPFIIDEIKTLFNISRIGLHRINIGNVDYVLEYVPVTINGEVVWETPLNYLDNSHLLRKDDYFMYEMQKILVFCDILALTSSTESHIIIRQGVDDTYQPINNNVYSTMINKKIAQNFSILTKKMMTQWGKTSRSEIAKNMLGVTNVNLLNIHIFELRDKVEKIINKYDKNYIWLSYFITTRISNIILCEDE